MTIASGQAILASDILAIQATANTATTTATAAQGTATAAQATATTALTTVGAAQAQLTPRTAPVGILIPYYVFVPNPYNDAAFSALLTLIRSNPAVPVIVVVNQGGVDGLGGPGPYDAAMSQTIRMLQGAGAAVCGYVSTINATRAPSLVQTDITNWNVYYSATPLDGVFFDQVPYDAGSGNVNVTLYHGYYSFAKSLGYKIVIGNPGSVQLHVWYDTKIADIYVCWENTSWPTPADFSIVPPQYYSGAITDYPVAQYAALVYGQGWSASSFNTLAPYMRWIYSTDNPSPATLGNPWASLPTYLSSLFAQAAALTGGTAATASAQVTANIAAAMLFGTGADGNVTISAGTTTLTRDMHYANLTINGTGALAPAGFRVFVSGTLDLSAAPSGAFVRSGFAGNAAAGVTGGVSQTNAAAYGMGSGAPNANAVGGAAGNSTNGVTPTVGFAPTNYGAGGDSGAGGVGGQGASSVPRSAGAIATVPGRAPFVTPATTLVMTYNTATSFQGVTHVMGGACGSGGSPGTGDGTNSGGGSGGAGGGGHVLAIWAMTIARGANSNTSIVQARGGNSGNGGTPPSGNCGGGAGSGGGGGGFVYIVTGGVTGSSIAGALDVSGGAGGAGGNGIGTGLGGNGGNGGNGGMVVVINIGAATTTVNSYNTAGTAGSTTATITGAAGGAGGSALVAL